MKKFNVEDHNMQETPNMVLVGRAEAAEYYVDGVTQYMLGYPVSRLYCHTTVSPRQGDDKEFRKVAMVLTMPTASLVEMAAQILANAKEREGVLSQFNENTMNKIREVLSSVDFEPNDEAL